MARVTREDWLENGLQVLAQSGVEMLTIDAMCRHLGVTKGSFYHHFKNREAYLEAILEFWEEKYTGQFIQFSQGAQNPAEQLERLTQLVVQSFGTEEVQLRAWAQHDPLARRYQERVDQRRLAFLYELQKDLYQNPVHARTMAQLQYAALIGSTEIMPALTADDLQAMYQLLARLSVSLQARPKETS
jgi:AcrR family transcriptional regulator